MATHRHAGGVDDRRVAIGAIGFALVHACATGFPDLATHFSVGDTGRSAVTVLAPLLLAPVTVLLVRAAVGDPIRHGPDVATSTASVAIVALASALLVGVGLLLLVVSGVVAALLLVYAIPAAALDGRGTVAAMGRSSRLVLEHTRHGVRSLFVAVFGTDLYRCSLDP